MSESLGDLLRKRDFDEPPEVKAIKEYVRRYYDAEVKVTVQPHAIVVMARSAALIGSLRMNLPKLQKAADTEKRIMLRIG
jgi:aromatic ring-opening dioxygenase LigB subunit